MEGLNTNDLLCCRFCSVSRLFLNAWKISPFCGRILGQLCINFGKSDGCVIEKCCLRHCYRGIYNSGTPASLCPLKSDFKPLKILICRSNDLFVR